MTQQRHWRRHLATLSLLLGGQLAAPFFFGNSADPAVAVDLDQIRQRGWLEVGVLDCLKPLACRDASGEWQGFEVDIARQLAKDLLGSESAVRFRPLRTADRLAAVIDERVDLAIAQMGITPARQRVVRFSSPYYFDATGLLAAPVAKLPDRPRVAVLQDSRSFDALQASALPFSLVPVNDYAQARQQLEAGQVQAIAADVTVLVGWRQAHPQWTLLPERLGASGLGVVMAKGRAGDVLARAVEQAILRWRQTGALQTWARRWGLP